MTLDDILKHWCPHFQRCKCIQRAELCFSELNGIDRTSLALISPWSNLNLYIMSILEIVCLLFGIRAYRFFAFVIGVMFNLSKFHSH